MKTIEENSQSLSFYHLMTDTLFLKIYFDTASQILYATWYGYVPIDVLVDAYIAIAKYLRVHSYVVLKGLTDLTNSEGSFESHNEWMVKEYLPKAIKYGYSKTAFVNPNDYFVNLSLEFFEEESEKYLQGHKAKIFDTTEAAEAWLKS